MKKRLVFISLITLMCLPSCNDGNKSDWDGVLVLTTTTRDAQHLKNVVDAFNLASSEYSVSVVSYAEAQIKNEEFASGEIETDLITFNNYIDANSVKDKLATLNLYEATYDYNTSIINYLKTESGELFVHPSPGVFYNNCYNMDLLSKYDTAIPNNLSERLALINLIKSNEPDIDLHTSTYGEDYIVNSLIEIGFPTMFSYTTGFRFIKDYVTNKATIMTSDYVDIWTKFFVTVKEFYSSGYYDLDQVDSESSSEIEKFITGQALSMSLNDYSSFHSSVDENLNYQMAPFVGTHEIDKWIGSSPMYYFSITTEADEDEEKSKAIDEFLSFYSSEIGQTEARFTSENNIRQDLLSYVKDMSFDIGDDYDVFTDMIGSKKFFTTDIYQYLFGLVEDSIVKYLSGTITVEELLLEMDEEVAKVASQRSGNPLLLGGNY